MNRIIIAILLFSSISCAQNAVPNLSPAGTAAYQGTKVILALDVIRDATIALANVNPPIVRREESVRIVEWHKAAITTIHASPSGWKATVATGLNEVRNNLNPQEKQQLGPYFSLAQTLINEVGR